MRMASSPRGAGSPCGGIWTRVPHAPARVAEARSLQQRIRAEAPRFTAPERLRARVMALSGGPAARAATRPPRDLRWQWIGAGALVGCAADRRLRGWRELRRSTAPTETDLASAAVAAHVRATLADQMIQVASSDQHTVKPWLSSHLDYSPPVQDLADEGFPLVGARIEYSRRPSRRHARLPLSGAHGRRLRAAGLAALPR